VTAEFDLSMLQAPVGHQETYILHLTGEQVGFLYELLESMKSSGVHMVGPIAGHLHAKIVHLRAIQGIAGDDEDVAAGAKRVMPEIYERLQKYVELMESDHA